MTTDVINGVVFGILVATATLELHAMIKNTIDMSEKDKELLLKDLCARLPYGVWFYFKNGLYKLSSIKVNHMFPLNDTEILLNDRFLIQWCKPYLHPMSSMTEEERDEMKRLLNPDGTGRFTTEGFIIPASHYGDVLDYSFLDDIRDYLDSKHFDHRGLIPKGLALEAKEGMYKKCITYDKRRKTYI